MPKISQNLSLKQQLSPQQVLQASLLQLNLPRLEQRILQELEINPALEMMDLPDELENDEILDVLKNLEVDYGQGCLFSKPKEIEDFLNKVD